MSPPMKRWTALCGVPSRMPEPQPARCSIGALGSQSRLATALAKRMKSSVPRMSVITGWPTNSSPSSSSGPTSREQSASTPEKNGGGSERCVVQSQ